VKVKTTPVDIESYGKICLYQGYLFISEPEKGIHIIDNRNPAHPQNIAFIELFGNTDIAIRNNLLYADSYIDLVWFDVSKPSVPTLKGRLENMFPTALPALDNQFGFDYEMCYNNAKGVVVGWNLKERTEEVERYTGGWFFSWTGNKTDATESQQLATNSVNGSMSRFVFYDNKLYSVVNGTMSIFDVSGDKPVKAAESVAVGWNVETLFNYKNSMFMGTPSGMLIFSVADPLKPVYKSFTTHIFGCDPVVVDNDIAYVTIRSGNTCGQTANQLLLYDVSDVANPKQLYVHEMNNPKGLGIDDGHLFLCDNGLKVFRLDSLQTINPKTITTYTGMNGYDLIPYNHNLIVIAQDGIYQYDYTDLGNIKFISKMTFKQ
jgi:hypothetical protein